MYFSTKRDTNYGLIIWGQTLIILLLPWVNFNFVQNNLLVVVTISAIYLAMLLWIWFGTGYEVSKNQLLIKSGPFRKKVAIESITEIVTPEEREDMMATFGPALSRERIYVFHGDDHDLIAISPENAGEFIKALKRENKQIHVGLEERLASR